MHTPAHKPDPAVQQAIQKLQQADLSPLEEQLFNGWMAANGMDVKAMDDTINYRQAYKDSEGKVMPPGQMQKQLEKESAIQVLMEAQKAHDEASPIQQMMQAMGQSSPAGSDQTDQSTDQYSSGQPEGY